MTLGFCINMHDIPKHSPLMEYLSLVSARHHSCVRDGVHKADSVDVVLLGADARQICVAI